MKIILATLFFTLALAGTAAPAPSRLEELLAAPGSTARTEEIAGRIATGRTTASVLAITVNAPEGLQRGVRIDLADATRKTSVFIEQALLPRLLKGLEDIVIMEDRMAANGARPDAVGGSAEFVGRAGSPLSFSAEFVQDAPGSTRLRLAKSKAGPLGDAAVFDFVGRSAAELIPIVERAVASLGVNQGPATNEPRFEIRTLEAAANPGPAPESAAVADVNNDGRLDIISAGNWYEAPNWVKHRIRDVPVSGGYVDSFSDLPLDVDGDGFIDVIQIGYFAHRIVWMKNPGRGAGEWTENLIEAVGPTEFAFLVDLDNDGRARELLPQFTGAANAPLCWYEFVAGKPVKHVVGDRSYGHGIGVGDLNGDRRNDILTPIGWLEAPADPRAAGTWTFHPQPWNTRGPAAPASNRPLEFGYMHLLDVNTDGQKDLVVTDGHNYGIYWFEQKAGGTWERREIDRSYSESHASVLIDFNGDGRPDLVTGKRFQARNQNDPGVAEPLGIYWYESRKAADNTVTWTRHPISEGGRMGTGLQLIVVDIDGDGDLDVVAPGKSGLFIAERK